MDIVILILWCIFSFWMGYDFGENSAAEEFKKGYIAGIDYERNRLM